jgi:hypothetical protein
LLLGQGFPVQDSRLTLDELRLEFLSFGAIDTHCTDVTRSPIVHVLEKFQAGPAGLEHATVFAFGVLGSPAVLAEVGFVDGSYNLSAIRFLPNHTRGWIGSRSVGIQRRPIVMFNVRRHFTWFLVFKASILGDPKVKKAL